MVGHRDAAITKHDLLRRGIEQRSNASRDVAGGSIGGIASCRRQRAGDTAAAGRRSGRILRVSDVSVYIFGAKPELFRDNLSKHRPSTRADVLSTAIRVY